MILIQVEYVSTLEMHYNLYQMLVLYCSYNSIQPILKMFTISF
ncbi:hypothetical protein Pgin04_01874 [Porphyromonas gingivalis]